MEARRDVGCWKEGTWGSWNKGRNYQFTKPDTMTLKRRQEVKSLPMSHPAPTAVSYLSETEGHRSADTIIPIHRTAGERERSECVICGVSPLGTDLL